jgi:hypothetical protein
MYSGEPSLQSTDPCLPVLSLTCSASTDNWATLPGTRLTSLQQGMQLSKCLVACPAGRHRQRGATRARRTTCYPHIALVILTTYWCTVHCTVGALQLTDPDPWDDLRLRPPKHCSEAVENDNIAPPTDLLKAAVAIHMQVHNNSGGCWRMSAVAAATIRQLPCRGRIICADERR